MSKEQPKVKYDLSQVATNPKTNLLVIGVVIVIAGYFAVHLLLGNKNTEEEKTEMEVPANIVRPVQDSSIVQIDQSMLPTVSEPVLDVPKVEVVPQVAQVVTPAAKDIVDLEPKEEVEEIEVPVKIVQDDQANKVQVQDNIKDPKRVEAKRRSGIMLISGRAASKTPEEIEQENSFVKRGSNDFLLARGKVIDVVLETAINTDFGGEITAVVSRDVFAEGGKNILIPKGSKAFGQYQAGLGAIYGRIAITWNRIDLLNGYSLNLDGVAVDDLGRTGIEGKIDHKFKEILTNSVFASLINIGIGYGLDRLVPPVIQNQTAGVNSNAATEINNLAFSIYQDPAKTDAQKIQSICGSVPPIIPLTAGDSYTQFVNTCNTLNVSPDPTNQKLQALMAAVNRTAVSIMTYTNNSVNPTQSQEASVQAFKDITGTIKDMMGAQPFAMNITVNQGTLIKIYVNKDYAFPKHVVMKRRYVQ